MKDGRGRNEVRESSRRQKELIRDLARRDSANLHVFLSSTWGSRSYSNMYESSPVFFAASMSLFSFFLAQSTPSSSCCIAGGLSVRTEPVLTVVSDVFARGGVENASAEDSVEVESDELREWEFDACLFFRNAARAALTVASRFYELIYTSREVARHTLRAC